MARTKYKCKINRVGWEEFDSGAVLLKAGVRLTHAQHGDEWVPVEDKMYADASWCVKGRDGVPNEYGIKDVKELFDLSQSKPDLDQEDLEREYICTFEVREYEKKDGTVGQANEVKRMWIPGRNAVEVKSSLNERSKRSLAALFGVGKPKPKASSGPPPVQSEPDDNDMTREAAWEIVSGDCAVSKREPVDEWGKLVAATEKKYGVTEAEFQGKHYRYLTSCSSGF
ncbi:MAG: hypothetical protein KDF65_16850 [Anaerolineae bacterium]|nr:hypothetical protein [Anaerolineae bacterium]